MKLCELWYVQTWDKISSFMELVIWSFGLPAIYYNSMCIVVLCIINIAVNQLIKLCSYFRVNNLWKKIKGEIFLKLLVHQMTFRYWLGPSCDTNSFILITFFIFLFFFCKKDNEFVVTKMATPSLIRGNGGNCHRAPGRCPGAPLQILLNPHTNLVKPSYKDFIFQGETASPLQKRKYGAFYSSRKECQEYVYIFLASRYVLWIPLCKYLMCMSA